LLVVIFGIYNNANAIPYTWEDSIAANVFFSHLGQTHTFTHYITDNGFVAGEDNVSSAELNLALSDDGNDSFELLWIHLPGPDALVEVNYTNVVLGLSLQGIAMLNAQGRLTVTLIDLFGDFNFNGSTLIAYGEKNSGANPVPEPATIFLMGSGLLGVGIVLRKKVKPRHE